jgi:APA family basic amino acid/polyamine antiporter
MSLLVLDPGVTAAPATGLASYGGYVVELPGLGRTAVAVGVVVLPAAANVAGLRPGAGLVRWLTLLKVGLLAVDTGVSCRCQRLPACAGGGGV